MHYGPIRIPLRRSEGRVLNPSLTNGLGLALERYRRELVFLSQTGLVVASYLGVFFLRFDLNVGQVPFEVMLKTLPLLIVARLASFTWFRLHRGRWRYVGIPDLVQIIKATTVSSLVFTVLVIVIFGLQGFPRSVFLLDWAGNLFLLGGIRLLARSVRERFRPMLGRDSTLKRLLIVGAGDAGAALCSQALATPGFRFKPVAFVDDDARKLGTTVLAVPVAGRCTDIPSVVREYEVDAAVIATPSATPSEMRSLVKVCQQAEVPFRVLPATSDLIDGTVSINRVRDVDPVDLMSRPSAKLDREAIQSFVRDKRILVTGGAGSVGSELARQVSILQPELLLLLDTAENPLFFLEAELRANSPSFRLMARVCDVTDECEVERVMGEYRPHVVLHAAAHKHVPLMERTPGVAVRNNVGGTLVVAKCSQRAKVETFVLVSTDKAVKPTSVMGATKRLAELLTQEKNHEGPGAFVSVRFGNVLGSNASVVPIFKQQIANGGPVTVTHPEACRYFMSLPEAAGLILQAGAIGAGGETFVLDMGDPVKIVSLAEMMIELSGLKPYEDIEIVFTGLRPGEKLSEDLYYDWENARPTGYEKLLAIPNSYPATPIMAQAEDLLRSLPTLDPGGVKSVLARLVPEYRPMNSLVGPE